MDVLPGANPSMQVDRKVCERREAGAEIATPVQGSPYPLLESLWVEDASANERTLFDMGEDITLCGVFNSPDDLPTIVMTGITRMDGTPVFGTFSNDGAFTANRLSPQRFGFRLALHAQTLLPGAYQLRAHTLDEHGLRLFDTREISITVSGKTRDHGLVRLAHQWLPGHERKQKE